MSTSSYIGGRDPASGFARSEAEQLSAVIANNQCCLGRVQVQVQAQAHSHAYNQCCLGCVQAQARSYPPVPANRAAPAPAPAPKRRKVARRDNYSDESSEEEEEEEEPKKGRGGGRSSQKVCLSFVLWPHEDLQGSAAMTRGRVDACPGPVAQRVQLLKI